MVLQRNLTENNEQTKRKSMKFTKDRYKILHLRWNNHASWYDTDMGLIREQLYNSAVRKYQPAVFLNDN